MNQRLTNALHVLAIAGLGAVLVPAFSVGQTPGTASKSAGPALAAGKASAPAAASNAATPPVKGSTMPRTPDGQPDLQGYWTNATFTPLERAANVTKPFYTKEEYEANAKRAAERDEQQTTPGTTADVHYDFTQFGLDKSQNPIALDLRTAMITDPPDGRIPALTPAAQQRQRERAAAVRAPGAQGDSVQTLPVGSRCIIANPGPPMLPQGYNGNYQIIQSKDTVMILIEQIGDIRIIPLDGRPAPPSTIRNWMGVSRGHWEGDTLVVETTNFNDRTEGRSRSVKMEGISPSFKLIERFKRLDDKTINYEFTVNDPDTYAKPWTANMPFAKIDGPIFEPACHEGNYGVFDTMEGYRVQEKQAAAKKAGQ